MNFARDMGRQDLLKNGEYSLEQAKKDFDIAKLNYNFTYTGIGYDQSNPAEYLLKHDMYLYATNEAGNINENVNSCYVRINRVSWPLYELWMER